MESFSKTSKKKKKSGNRAEERQKNFWEAEIMFKIPRHLFRANKKEKTFTEAVDKTIDALLGTIRKEKELLKESKIQNNIKRRRR